MINQTSQQNPYLDAEGKPQLHFSYCLYFDILGFGEQIKKAVEAQRESECFENFYSFFSSFLENLEMERHGSIYTTLPKNRFHTFWIKKSFSDNIIIGMPINSADRIGEFILAIDQVSRIQLRFALEGYFIRGGWSIGNLAIDDNIVWGLPLVEAHNLESKIAKYPRIVFSETMKQVITVHLERYKNDSEFLRMSPQYNQLLISSDQIFINYLSELINDGSGYMTDIDLEKLAKHKHLIETRLTEHAHSRKILIKYRWLAAYHDAFCEGISDHPEYSEEYKIRQRHSLCITGLDGSPWRRRIIMQQQ